MIIRRSEEPVILNILLCLVFFGLFIFLYFHMLFDVDFLNTILGQNSKSVLYPIIVFLFFGYFLIDLIDWILPSFSRTISLSSKKVSLHHNRYRTYLQYRGWVNGKRLPIDLTREMYQFVPIHQPFLITQTAIFHRIKSIEISEPLKTPVILLEEMYAEEKKAVRNQDSVFIKSLAFILVLVLGMLLLKTLYQTLFP